MGPKKSKSSHFQRSPHTGHQAVTPSAVRLPGTDKSLGQHWLSSPSVIQKIVDRADGLAGILEVGPGPGILTEPLSQIAEVTAVEFDKRIIDSLQAAAPQAKIIQGDALETDLAQILEQLPSPRGIVSNMPYHITGPLLESFSNLRHQVSRMILMMQLEVGEKIMAPVGDRRRGVLSVAMQSLFTVTKVVKVPPGAFRPPPKVDSIVLELTPRDDVPVDFEGVMQVVRRAFSHPRKTVLNNLKPTLEVASLERVLVDAGLTTTIRPHEITFEQWRLIAQHAQRRSD
ncbi:16S rRNA (adenine(1518)-N(6)/adenine(1519)-N(6))-dimethyltransferase RsmA [Kamptonema cortianum]|nr:16S rRNA (adenine(1518)-N(6)/adenine(1519)-N(6))-dimethyltransferase RsmA [Kamptonema cortianum]